ncbi:MAG: ABC transporter substrate-binding protein, partial [Nitrospinae bacterium]|nr:ABC transporter substrate-binding protein [Nitrospinota bacterium]
MIKRNIIFELILALAITILSATMALASPQRIISLSPAVTEQLHLLGEYDKIVGNTTYCLVPAGQKGKEKVGTIVDINIEKIVGLKPDLILTTQLTNDRSIRKLKDMGIKVEVFPQPKGFEEICQQFIRLGDIVRKRDKAEEIVSKAKGKVREIRKRVEMLPKPKVFVQLGAKPLFTATGDSFVDDFIDFAGGVNITHNLKRGLITREEVIKKNPDIIMIVTMGIAGDREKKVWRK